MLSEFQLNEIQKRIESTENAESPPEPFREAAAALLGEVRRLNQFMKDHSAKVESNLNVIEADMLKLEAENERLRTVRESTYFERDACIGLLARMATALGFSTGTCQAEILQENMDGKRSLQKQNRVVIDLPSGQVSWDYLEDEAHLFEALPAYPREVQAQSIREIYSKVMNPGIETEHQA